MKATEIAPCPDCGSAHLGRCGGLTFVQRLRSIRLDTSVIETRTRHRYYDAESLDEMFGIEEKERVEQVREETKGRGPMRLQDATPDDLSYFTGDDIEEDGDAV